MENYLDFTNIAEENFYNTVDAEDFLDDDAESIYKSLNKSIKLIPFGDYLKRYIYKKAGFEGDLNEIPLKEYQYIIIDSFKENFTPCSFTPNTSKISSLAKNWLTQNSVKREIIFLLGFGLNMSVDDVSEFLINAQAEKDFNFKNPFEVICWYCYKNKYKYPEFVKLYDSYKQLPVNEKYLNLDETVNVRGLFQNITTESGLIAKLSEIKYENKGNVFSVSAKKHYQKLYDKTRKIIADKYTEDAVEKAKKKSFEYMDLMSRSYKLSDEEKVRRTNAIKNKFQNFEIEDINESDVEKFLCCGVPYDGNGNLTKASKSTLANHFQNKRMSRKHLNDINNNKVDVDRFDIITLSFFVFAMDEEISNQKRYFNFVTETNKILGECNMGKLYIANPYESFLLMCILSDYPMGAYSDVLELSFDESEIL